jgi:parallel beta-helix repeat protein
MEAHRSMVICLVVAVIGLAGIPCYAGGLEPPVPPGTPTMKPLNELEPRRPIYPDMLPLTITESGSYYLAENIVTTGGGITVDTTDVTIDLNGFALEGGTGVGINYTISGGRITVRNGTVSGWASHGISVGFQALVENVLVRDNGGIGINTEGSSRVFDCYAYNNDADGIWVGSDSMVRGTTAVSSGNNGIRAETSGMVLDCIVRNSGANGIRVDYESVVRGNLCTQNWVGDVAGILAVTGSSRIEGNHVSSNTIGIRVNGTANIVIRNSAVGNITDYDIPAGNDAGPIGKAATATSPWANLH